MQEKKVFRRCAMSKDFLPRNNLFRIVRTPDGSVLFEKEVFLLGRGVHFKKERSICERLFSQKNGRSILSFLLKTPLSEKDILFLRQEVLSVFKNDQ